MKKKHRLILPEILVCAIVFVSGCGKQSGPHEKPVRHFFTDADLVEAQGILAYPEDGSPLRSRMTYPHEDTLWVQSWQGKQALRFESMEQGDLRGSLYTMHQKIESDFHLTASSWLEADGPETWSGFVFWMQNHKHATGIRWKPQKYKKNVLVQIIKYDSPHANAIHQSIFPFENSHWASIDLTVKDHEATLVFDGNRPIVRDLNPAWNEGNVFGFFQGEGTGFYADLTIQSGSTTLDFGNFFAEWNREMVNTTRWVLLEKTPTPDDFIGHALPIRRISIADDWRVSVPVHTPSQITFKVFVPQEAILHAAFGVLPSFFLTNTTAEFQIAARTKEGEEILQSKTLTPARESVKEMRYHDWHVPLDAYAGREIDLIFRVNRKGGDEPLIACWSEPAIAQRNSPHKKPNVLLILLDTLRSDRVGVYGNPRGLTPHIDHLAARGTTFLNTISQAPWTVPSHASFFTSLYPSETLCDNSGNRGNILQEGYLTWAEYLQREGYSTAAMTAGLAIRGNVGMCQGFDTWQDIMYDLSYSFETVFERYRNWQDDHRGEPWFMFLHTYAIHFPYKHAQFVDYRIVPRNWDDQRALDNDTYDSGVRFADEWVGSILRDLEKRGLMDETLIILTSDHGEELGERWMPRPAHHGHSLYDELLKVPLIFHFPGTIPSGKRIEKQVRLLDLLPTVLDILEVPLPLIAHGISLTNLMRDRDEPERFAFSEGMTYGVALRAVRTKDNKFIIAPDPNHILDDTPTGIPVPQPDLIQLFDLQKDPGETHNLAKDNPLKTKEVQSLYDLIQGTLYRPELFTDGSKLLEPPIISPRIMEGLQDLGYVAK